MEHLFELQYSCYDSPVLTTNKYAFALHNVHEMNNALCDVQNQEDSRLDLPIGLSLADKLKLLREREGYSQRSLAKEIGIPSTTLASIESGKNKSITIESLDKFAEHEELCKYAMWLWNDQFSKEQIDAMTAYADAESKTSE